MRSPASIRRCLVECIIAMFSASWRDDPGLRSLALGLFNHVVDDVAMPVLRAEHDDLRVSVNPHIGPRWPVEQVIGADCLLLAGRIGRGEFTAHHEAPMGTLTEVSFQPLE